jgi:hypothetical protein
MSFSKSCYNLTKKLFVFFSLIFFVTSVSRAQEIKYADNGDRSGFNLKRQNPAGIEINFSISSFFLNDVMVDAVPMKTVGLPGVFLPNDAGKPDLAGTGRYIAIPQGATATYNIISYKTDLIKNVNIAPAPIIPTDNDPGPLKYPRNNKIYNQNALYPESPVSISPVSQIRGVDVVMLGITPFQYNPITKELTVYTDLEVEVTFVGGNGHFGNDAFRSRWWEPILSDAIYNYSSLSKIDFDHKYKDIMSETGYEYVIIVPNNSEFSQWADTIKRFRSMQGIKTGIFKLSDIGGNSVATIKSWVNNAYNTWTIKPAAICLLADYGTDATGDTCIISKLQVHNEDYPDYASDNYYADVNGDELPEIVFSRIVANNATELQTMISKNLDYERNPPSDANFYLKPITALGWQTTRWFQLCSEIVGGYFKKVQNKIPTRINKVYDGTPGTVWSSNVNTSTVVNYFGTKGNLKYIPMTPDTLGGFDGGTPAQIVSAINAGAFLLQHRDHGSYTGWGEPAFTTSYASQLTNVGTKLPFFYSINCETGAYHNPTGVNSFVERFYKYTYNGQNSGALGMVCPSEVSYSYVNDVYVWGNYDNMWPNFMPGYGTTPATRDVKPAFGMAAGKFFLQQSSWPYNPGDKTITYRLFHMHGDAFLNLYSEVPQNLTVSHSSVIVTGATSFTFTADAGAFVALSINSEILGTATATGSSQVISIPGTQTQSQYIDVIITKQNYYRHTSRVLVVSNSGYSGIKTIPGDFATLKDALAELNTKGVGIGGVTFNIASGYTESNADSLKLTATGTVDCPIVFRKDPATTGANPLITRTDAGIATTSTAGGRGDAIIIIEGSDYVTFNGIDVKANNQGIEYGYYIRKASATDGCKYVTIKNCVITMTKGTSGYVIGLYSSNNVAGSSLSVATGVTVTSEGGRHENITITGNTTQNTTMGMYFIGYNHATSPYNYYDQNFVIGAEGEGNIIKNFGGGAASTSNGINIMYHNNESISYNTINNTDGGNTGFTSFGNGILLNTGKAVTCRVSYNTISLTTLSGAKYLYLIQVNVGDAASSVTINNNTFQDCVNNSTGAFSAIQHGTAAGINIYSNTFTNLTSAASISVINQSAGTVNNQIYNNTISNITTTGATSTIYGISIAKGPNTVYNNLIYDLNSTSSSTTADAIRGISITSTTASSTIGLYNNTIYLNSMTGGADFWTSCVYHTYNATATTASLDMRNNILVNTSTPSGAGKTVAFRRSAATDLNNYSTSSNNNLFYAGTPGASNLIFDDGTNSDQTLADYKTRVSPRDANSVSGDPGLTSATNLQPDVTNANSWNIKGKGDPTVNIATDYAGNSRSTTVAGGATCPGAYEFTPSVSPANALQTGTIVNGETTTYTVAGDIVTKITWHGANVPTSVSVKYRPGENPPNPISGSYYSNLCWNITATGGSGYTYDIELFYTPALLGTISTETAVRLCKYSSSWEQFSTAPNTTTHSVTVTGLSSFSYFAFGDENHGLPVELSSFTSNVNGRNVKLQWTTVTELNNAGFEVQRKAIGTDEWSKVSFLTGRGNSNSSVQYTYEDKKLNSGKYDYRLNQVDNNGNSKYHTLGTVIEIGVPTKYDLSQNYPNPFNPMTKINYDLPFDSRVMILVYDVLGREMKQLVNQQMQKAGYYTIEFNASNFASGIYFYRMISNANGKDFVMTKKMSVIK